MLNRHIATLALVGSSIAALSLYSAASAHTSHTMAREYLVINQGDTMTPRFAMRTDSVLKLAGGSVVGAKCGTSVVFMRLWKNGKAITGDSVNVEVVNCATPAPQIPPPVGVLSIFNDEVLDTINGVPTVRLTNRDMAIGDVGCLVTVMTGTHGVIITGQPVTYSSSDPSVASVDNSAMLGCPDTTVDPAKMPYPFPTPITTEGSANVNRTGS